MERIDFFFVVTGLVVLGMAATAGAQSPPPPPPPGAGPDVFFQAGPAGVGGGEGFVYMGFEKGLGGKVVKGAPYAAETTTETTQILSDGNRIYRKSIGQRYRDSEGRTRRENSLPALGPLWAFQGSGTVTATAATTASVSGEAPQVVFINDPMAGTSYVLEPNEKIARKMNAHPRGLPGSLSSSSAPVTAKLFAGQVPQPQTESLGKQTIEGIEAEGTRTTITIPAGQIGNDHPIVIVSERWYSPDLQTLVMSKHNDPRMGETVFRLTNIRREQQPASLFEVPPDYTIQEGHGFGPGKMIMRQPALPGPPPPGEEPEVGPIER